MLLGPVRWVSYLSWLFNVEYVMRGSYHDCRFQQLINGRTALVDSKSRILVEELVSSVLVLKKSSQAQASKVVFKVRSALMT